MKKFTALLLCLLMAAFLVVPTFAATREDVLSYAKDKIPAKYELYHIWAENILNQYDLTEAEWDEVLAILEDLSDAFPTDEGPSLHEYTAAHRAEAMDALNRFCEVTGSTYLVRAVANPKHEGDQEVLLYDASGKLVATLDGDLLPDKTGENTASAWLIALSAVLFSMAVATTVVIRRRANAA